MEIAAGVHQYTLPAVNAYLIETSQGLILVDTGTPIDAKRLEAMIRADGFDPAQITFIFLTHGDADHIGSTAHFKTLSHAQVIAHPADVPLIEGRARREPGQSRLRPLVQLVYPVLNLTPMFKVAPVTVDRTVVEGDTLPDGWRVVYLPGHTPGLVGLYNPEQKVVIAGDAISSQRDKLSPPPAIFTPDMDAAHASIRKLAGYDFETLGVGHGPAITRGADDAVARLADSL
ncbi:MAG: MBL fold metallo-hydrolase [Anaerolineae bacterium]